MPRTSPHPPLHPLDPAPRPRPRRLAARRGLAAALAAALVFAAGCDGATSLDQLTSDARPTSGDPGEQDGPSHTPHGELQWEKCLDGLARAARLQCTSLAVPVDPADPAGATTELALARRPASGSASSRIGSLLINPGGPGGSGIEALANLSYTLPEELRERFDLVSWDPRGVASSSPVRCVDDAGKDERITGDLSPDTPEEFQRAVDDQAGLREGCESRNPDLVQHLSTADVAADLERIREALGEDQLDFLGFSYGTSIGATYATLHPDRVRAMVLDGSVSPSADGVTASIEQAKAFETAYLHFVAACDADPACALSGGAAAKVQAVRDRLDATPLTLPTASGDRALSMDLFDLGLATALYDPSLWGLVALAVAQLDDGGGEAILALVDTQLGRQPDGTWDNSLDSRAMVNCLDDAVRPTVEEARAIGFRIAAEVPTFGDAFSTSALGCVDWPTAANPRPAPTGAGAPAILVIGTLGDPATPYAWSQQMSEALESGVLLSYEGEGHTAFTRGGSCVDDAVVRYLVDLQVPTAGTSCPAAAASFEGVESMLGEQLVGAGIPEDVAGCIVDALVEQVGALELAVALLQQDELGDLESQVAQATMACMTGG